jgi:hypothetical protein
VLLARQKSTKERLARKKYIGVWRWESELIARMINKLPTTVIIYMQRNREKRSVSCSGFSESPRRMNSDALLWFFVSMCMIPLVMLKWEVSWMLWR